MKSFIELDGQAIFITPESISSIHPRESVFPAMAGMMGMVSQETRSYWVVISTHNNGSHHVPCVSMQEAKTKSHALAEKVDEMLTARWVADLQKSISNRAIPQATE